MKRITVFGIILILIVAAIIFAPTLQRVRDYVFPDLSKDKSVVNTFAIFYYPDDDAEEVQKLRAEYDGDIQSLIDTLAVLGGVPKGTKVLSFEVKDKTATIDLSKEFENGLVGTTGEYLTIASLVNTLIDCYEIDSVILKVQGEHPDTGHNIYDEPLGKMG